MDEMERLSHTKWECKYQAVFIPKWRRRLRTRNCDGTWAKCSASWRSQKESRVKEGHLAPDHLMIAIPPKYAVSRVIGFIKGKSAIHLARVCGEQMWNFVE